MVVQQDGPPIRRATTACSRWCSQTKYSARPHLGTRRRAYSTRAGTSVVTPPEVTPASRLESPVAGRVSMRGGTPGARLAARARTGNPPRRRVMTDMTTLDDAASLGAKEHGLTVISTLRADGTIQSSVVNAGVMRHPLAEQTVLAFVSYGRVKLANLRVRPQLSGCDCCCVRRSQRPAVAMTTGRNTTR